MGGRDILYCSTSSSPFPFKRWRKTAVFPAHSAQVVALTKAPVHWAVDRTGVVIAGPDQRTYPAVRACCRFKGALYFSDDANTRPPKIPFLPVQDQAMTATGLPEPHLAHTNAANNKTRNNSRTSNKQARAPGAWTQR